MSMASQRMFTGFAFLSPGAVIVSAANASPALISVSVRPFAYETVILAPIMPGFPEILTGTLTVAPGSAVTVSAEMSGFLFPAYTVMLKSMANAQIIAIMRFIFPSRGCRSSPLLR